MKMKSNQWKKEKPRLPLPLQVESSPSSLNMGTHVLSHRARDLCEDWDQEGEKNLERGKESVPGPWTFVLSWTDFGVFLVNVVVTAVLGTCSTRCFDFQKTKWCSACHMFLKLSLSSFRSQGRVGGLTWGAIVFRSKEFGARHHCAGRCELWKRLRLGCRAQVIWRAIHPVARVVFTRLVRALNHESSAASFKSLQNREYNIYMQYIHTVRFNIYIYIVIVNIYCVYIYILFQNEGMTDRGIKWLKTKLNQAQSLHTFHHGHHGLSIQILANEGQLANAPQRSRWRHQSREQFSMLKESGRTKDWTCWQQVFPVCL